MPDQATAPASTPAAALAGVKALTFDVFGTCVDWHTSITNALVRVAEHKLTSPSFNSAPFGTRWRVAALTRADWAAFAHDWRAEYGRFTWSFCEQPPSSSSGSSDGWISIDEHHLASLSELLSSPRWRLLDLYTDAELLELSRAWHFLDAWPDAAAGLAMMRRGGGRSLVTATLSNGNRALLEDLDRYASLGFDRLLSAEDFRTYKPDPKVYLGACTALGREPGEVAMVAAHLGDLKAARACGLRTIYVERRGEEEWKPGEEEYERAREWVDLWIKEEEEGFVAVARALGCEAVNEEMDINGDGGQGDRVDEKLVSEKRTPLELEEDDDGFKGLRTLVAAAVSAKEVVT